MTQLLTVGGIISLLINFSLGVFVYVKNPKQSINRHFSFFSLSLAVWSGGSFLANMGISSLLALGLLRFCYIAAVFLPAFYIHFIFKIIKQKSGVIIPLYYGISASLSFFLPTRFFITGIRQAEDGFLISSPGPIYYIFFIFMNIGTIYGLYCLLNEILKSHGINRTQLKWMFLAQFLAQLAGLEYFSAVFKWWDHVPCDDYILVAYFVIMTYAIVRHQLLDIEVIIKRTLVFTGLLAMVMLVVGFITTLTQNIMSRYLQIPVFAATVVSVGIVLMFYDPAKRFLLQATDRFLFQKKEDIRLILKKLAHQVVRIHSSKQLGQTVLETLKTTIRPESAAIWIRSENGDYHILENYGLKNQEVESLTKKDLLVNFFTQFKGVINLTDQKTHDNLPTEMLRQFKQMEVILILPLLQEDELVGLLFLGKKMSDEEYTAEELEYLPTIANQIAVGLNFSKAIEQQKTMLMDYAQQSKLATLGTLTAGIGHEINNPVNNISGCVGMLQLNLKRGVYDALDKAEFVRETQDVLSMVEDNTKRIASIIKRLSLFSKRPKDFKTSEVSPVAVIEDALANVKSQLDQCGVTVEKKIPKHVPSMQVDFGSVSQSLVAIFINGIQAMGPSGRFTVGVASADAGFVEIFIKDTGSGIEAEHLEKIFDPFFTTKDSVEPSLKGEQGTGLGLYIVQLLIQMNGGRIKVDSIVGQGTTFHLYFPTLSL